jgi:crotonobetainyl-CoA:carnitine CoA-transferase CaiB-like acyl-CoA transferase
MLVAPVSTAPQLFADPHLRKRQYWRDVVYADGVHVGLGPLFRPRQSPADRDRQAPDLASSSDEPPPVSGRRAAQGAPAGGPLDGVTVVDLTVSWAGPSATKILAQLGARVVKIESPARIDQWRGEVVDPYLRSVYPDGEPGSKSYNRNCWFNSQNHDKLSLILDLKHPSAVDALRRMLPKVDLVVSNFSPGAANRLGLGGEQVQAFNPKASSVQMPAAGNDAGGLRRRGFGPTMEAMAGMTAYVGYEDGPPLGSGSSYLDPVGGLNGASASVTAIYHAAVFGAGLDIELSQQEAAMHWAGEVLLEDIEAGAARPRSGNALPDVVPHGAFPAAGEDEWIAIACFTDEQWRLLARIVGASSAFIDAHAALHERVADREAIESLLRAWTSIRPKHKAAAELQEAGISAAPVQSGADLTVDPQLRARDWYKRFGRDDLPAMDYPTSPLVIAGERLRPSRLSPMFGEDTETVLREIAGLSRAEIDALFASGASAREPVVPA